MHKTKHNVVTDLPLTAEAHESLLEDLFTENLPHYGEIFIPNDIFYAAKSGHELANHMMLQLCQWLGIKPGYIGLEYTYSPDKSPDGRRYTIYIESWVLEDEFYLGAALAYALTRYLIEEKKQIKLPAEEQSALLAAASAKFGLGLVVMNGLSPVYGWADKWIAKIAAPKHSVIGSFPGKNYTYLVRGFISKYRVNPTTFRHSLAPWTFDRLGLKPSARPSKAVKETMHKIHLENIKLAGTCWVLLVILGLGAYVFSMRVTPLSPEVAQTQEQLTLLSNVSRECKDSVIYKRQYADLTDIQTVRNINSEELRCQSLDNQRDVVEQHYRRLTTPEQPL